MTTDTTLDALQILSLRIEQFHSSQLASNSFIQYYEHTLGQFGDDSRVKAIDAGFREKIAPFVEMVTRHQDILYNTVEAIAKAEDLPKNVGELLDTLIHSRDPVYVLLKTAADGKTVNYQSAKDSLIEFNLELANLQFDREMGLVITSDDAPEVAAAKQYKRENSQEERSHYLGVKRQELGGISPRRLTFDYMVEKFKVLTMNYSRVLDETQDSFEQALNGLEQAYTEVISLNDLTYIADLADKTPISHI